MLCRSSVFEEIPIMAGLTEGNKHITELNNKALPLRPVAIFSNRQQFYTKPAREIFKMAQHLHLIHDI